MNIVPALDFTDNQPVKTMPLQTINVVSVQSEQEGDDVTWWYSSAIADEHYESTARHRPASRVCLWHIQMPVNACPADIQDKALAILTEGSFKPVKEHAPGGVEA